MFVAARDLDVVVVVYLFLSGGVLWMSVDLEICMLDKLFEFIGVVNGGWMSA